MSLAEFATEPELMLAHGVRHDIRQHASDIVAAFGRRDSDLFETAETGERRQQERAGSYHNIGSAQNRLTVDQSIRAQVKAIGRCVEAVIGVVENLIEVF